MTKPHPPMERLNTPPKEPILSIMETVALMAKRPGITVGGGIETNTPNPDPRADEVPVNEYDVQSDHRIREWWAKQRVLDRASENLRKKVSGMGGRYFKPLRWEPGKKAELLKWRRGFGIETTGTGVSGRVNPKQWTA